VEVCFEGVRVGFVHNKFNKDENRFNKEVEGKT